MRWHANTHALTCLHHKKNFIHQPVTSCAEIRVCTCVYTQTQQCVRVCIHAHTCTHFCMRPRAYSIFVETCLAVIPARMCALCCCGSAILNEPHSIPKILVNFLRKHSTLLHRCVTAGAKDVVVIVKALVRCRVPLTPRCMHTISSLSPTAALLRAMSARKVSVLVRACLGRDTARCRAALAGVIPDALHRLRGYVHQTKCSRGACVLCVCV